MRRHLIENRHLHTGAMMMMRRYLIEKKISIVAP
jgi:hypothetical protein